MRLIICTCKLLAFAGGTSTAEVNESIELIIVDRSMSKDSLYSCNLNIPKDTPLIGSVWSCMTENG